jgi:hypothetical protein
VSRRASACPCCPRANSPLPPTIRRSPPSRDAAVCAAREPLRGWHERPRGVNTSTEARSLAPALLRRLPQARPHTSSRVACSRRGRCGREDSRAPFYAERTRCSMSLRWERAVCESRVVRAVIVVARAARERLTRAAREF